MGCFSGVFLEISCQLSAMSYQVKTPARTRANAGIVRSAENDKHGMGRECGLIRRKSKRERVNAGRAELDGGWGCGEGMEAVADVVAEEVDGDAAKCGRVGLEFAQGGGQEAGGAQGVLALEVMEGDGDLDEALQECLFGLRCEEPDALPGFVGFEEACSVVVAQAFCERAVDPVEGHRRTVRAGMWGGFNMIFDPGRRVGDEAHCG